jgi:dihydroorotate dehydrogenase
MELNPRRDLSIQPGWMNAPGTLGFVPPAAWPWPGSPVAFVTDPLSEHHRDPAANRAVREFPGGVLLHSGWPNPGIRTAIKNFAGRWARCDLPVWVCLLAETPQGMDRMVRRLEDCENVQAVEISLLPGCRDEEALALVRAGLGELPLVLAVEPERLGEVWLPEALADGVSAISLAAPRGALPGGKGGLITGRLYGPGLFPVGLAALQRARKLGLPVIAGGGVCEPAQMEAFLTQGAAAVQVDIALWGSPTL